MANALGAIAGAMAAGELTLDEAGAVAGVLEAKRRAIETVEHEERLRKLEERSPGERVIDERKGMAMDGVPELYRDAAYHVRSKDGKS